MHLNLRIKSMPCKEQTRTLKQSTAQAHSVTMILLYILLYSELIRYVCMCFSSFHSLCARLFVRSFLVICLTVGYAQWDTEGSLYGAVQYTVWENNCFYIHCLSQQVYL